MEISQRETPVGFNPTKQTIMLALEIYNAVKKEMLKPSFRNKMKKLKFPLRDFNEFLRKLRSLCLKETMARDCTLSFINKEFQNISNFLKAGKLKRKVNKKAKEKQSHQATQDARILFMSL